MFETVHAEVEREDDEGQENEEQQVFHVKKLLIKRWGGSPQRLLGENYSKPVGFLGGSNFFLGVLP